MLQPAALQFFKYESIMEDGNFWMIEDPTICERNAQRILDIWSPFVNPIVQEVKGQERSRRAAPCLAFFCSFNKAQQLAASSAVSDQPPAASAASQQPDLSMQLWQTMAKVPPEVLHLIATEADLVYTKAMADAPV